MQTWQNLTFSSLGCYGDQKCRLALDKFIVQPLAWPNMHVECGMLLFLCQRSKGGYVVRREGWDRGEWVRNMGVLIARPLSVTSTVKTLN